jgi:hypothetical protein
VAEVIQNHSWTRDIQGDLSMVGLFEFFFQLWDVLLDVALSHEDKHCW